MGRWGVGYTRKENNNAHSQNKPSETDGATVYLHVEFSLMSRCLTVLTKTKLVIEGGGPVGVRSAPELFFFQLLRTTRRPALCNRSISAGLWEAESDIRRFISNVFSSRPEEKKGGNRKQKTRSRFSLYTFHSWHQSELELDQQGSHFPVKDQLCICSPSMTASNSDRVHLANKAWWIWMWWAWVEIGTGGERLCPVCSGTASCASLRVPLRLSKPALEGGPVCVWYPSPLLALIALNKNLCPCLLAPILLSIPSTPLLIFTRIVAGLNPWM